MTEEDLYPWKKKYRKSGNSKAPPKKAPRRRPPVEEVRRTPKKPKSDSSSDEMAGGNPKNFDFYFNTNKKDKSNPDSKGSQKQPEQGGDANSKDGAKQNADAMGTQPFRAENVPPTLNHFITDLPTEPIQVPELPEYPKLPKVAKIEASQAKVHEWLNRAPSSVPPIATLSLNELPRKAESLVGYNAGYYVTGAAAAGLAALVGAAIYLWRGVKEQKEGYESEDEIVKVNRRARRSHRLHARDWQRADEG